MNDLNALQISGLVLFWLAIVVFLGYIMLRYLDGSFKWQKKNKNPWHY